MDRTDTSVNAFQDIGTRAALQMKLGRLTPLNIASHSSRHPNQPSTTSSASSRRSSGSWHSEQTTATDAVMTSFRSQANATWKSDMSTAPNFAPCKPPLKVILGTASVGSSASPMARITSTGELHKYTDSFRSRGYADIDTARAYPVGRGGTCEMLLGDKSLRLKTWANTSTKVSSFLPGSHKANNVAASIDRSLEALDLECVDIMYLHAPDRATPLYETCKAMDKAYQQGKFERFGLSNYTVEQVEEMIQICSAHDFIEPSVYQGQYNPICRGAEDRLFSVLRQHNVSFYAYSPSACGFFSNNVSRASTQDKTSRWNIAMPLGAKYAGDYFHDHLFAAAETVKYHAKRYGISGHAAALRWTTWHSQLAAEHGDAIIIGASKQTQLEENLDILEQGPLPEPLVRVIDEMWQSFEAQAINLGPRFSFL